MADSLEHVVVWKSLLMNGTDHCAIWRTTEGWRLRGTVVGVLKDQRPMLAQYEIHCDSNWLTHWVHVENTVASDIKTLTLTVERRGGWRCSGQELHDLRGCDDVDLAVTPATNTIPIRRLDLQIGQRAAAVAAWIKVPELTVEPLFQHYTRLSKNTYRYESDTGFSAEIVVDDLGFVTSYPGWERIAATL
jgi:hypothetical protein